MENLACNVWKFNKGTDIICGKPAKWKHPRWPTGMYCEEHKKLLAEFFPNNWSLIKEDENGKGTM